MRPFLSTSGGRMPGCLSLATGLLLAAIECHAAPVERIHIPPVAVPEPVETAWYEDLHEMVHNRLEAGFRLSYISLSETTRREFDNTAHFTRGFLGSIDRLEANTSLTFAPYVNVMFSDSIGMELSWQSFSVSTFTYFDNHTDGRFVLAGPSCQVLFRHPNETIFTPRLGFGAVFLKTDFDEDPAWRLGFSADEYAKWLNEGRPGGDWPNYGFVQVIDTGSAASFMVSAGCQAQLADDFYVDVDIRYVKTDIDGHYYMSQYGKVVDDRGTTTFPMSALYLALGLRYDF